MAYPLLIPDIAQDIAEVLEKLKLKPAIKPADFIVKTKGKKHRYYSLCVNPKNEKVFFYARLQKNPYEKEKIMTEIQLAKVFIQKPSFSFFPRYFNTGKEKNFEWLTREYFADSSLEKKTEIEKIKRRLKEKEVLILSQSLIKMSNVDVKKLPFLKKFATENYINCHDLEEPLLKEKVLIKKDIQALNQLLTENKDLLSKENRYFTHGDFHIGNIIFSDGELKIVDLESAHINNFAYDIAFLTSHLWKEKKTRQKVLEDYWRFLPQEKKATFPALFCIDSFYIGYNLFRSAPLEYSAEELAKRRNFYKKFLRNTLRGFTALSGIKQ